jgi:hypothetical protein
MDALPYLDGIPVSVLESSPLDSPSTSQDAYIYLYTFQTPGKPILFIAFKLSSL